MGVLIVEAEIKSGTGITARYAKEQGKEIFCIPSSIGNRKGIGTNNQIKKGAKLVIEPSEILDEYGGYKHKQITIDDLTKQTKVSAYKLNEIKEEYRKIYEILYEPLNINEISLKTRINITELYTRLFMMEMEGLIAQDGNKYIIKGDVI